VPRETNDYRRKNREDSSRDRKMVTHATGHLVSPLGVSLLHPPPGKEYFRKFGDCLHSKEQGKQQPLADKKDVCPQQPPAPY
jgi:hypothetical protein